MVACSSFFFNCSKNPDPLIQWLFWGPIHPCVIQVYSPFHWRVQPGILRVVLFYRKMEVNSNLARFLQRSRWKHQVLSTRNLWTIAGGRVSQLESNKTIQHMIMYTILEKHIFVYIYHIYIYLHTRYHVYTYLYTYTTLLHINRCQYANFHFNQTTLSHFSPIAAPRSIGLPRINQRHGTGCLCRNGHVHSIGYSSTQKKHKQ